MSHIFTSTQQLIGHTPLLELTRTERKENLCARLLAKVESFNPAGSVKDRAALYMLNTAEEAGILKPDSVIIEPTSGNTGIGIASIAAARGYRCIIVMPESMSRERRIIMKAYGAELVLSPAAKGMAGAVEMAKELAKKYENSFIPGQFTNPANVAAHVATTGPEIYEDTDGQIDYLVAGFGTGGTVSGVGQYLKSRNPNIQVIAVEPAGSPLLTKGIAGPHKIQGIGANFIPEILDRSVIDRVVTVTNEDAYAAARAMGPTEGLLVGVSSGAAIYAGMCIAKLPENKGKTVVVVLPDSGERYLSTDLYQE